jgi:ribosomal protein S18 acetylase RimI-like enzyme
VNLARKVRRAGWRAPFKTVRWAFRRALRNKHIIVATSQAPSLRPSDFQVVRVTARAQIDERLRVQLTSLSEHSFELLESHFARGASLWLALDAEGELAGSAWLLPASGLRAWYMPVAEHDLVVFGVVTSPALRGRGVAPAIIAAALKVMMAPGTTAYADIKQWNRPSLRLFEKLGFEVVAVRPAQRDAAPVPTAR